MSEINNIRSLRELYKNNAAVKAVLDNFAARERNANVTKVDRLFSMLEQSGVKVSRWDLVKALRALADLGYGRFVVGRKGHPSRVEWRVGIVSLGKAAAGTVDKIEPACNGESDLEEGLVAAGTPVRSVDGTSGTMMNVRFPLRAELEVEMALPKTLTHREAERLSEFIKTLPFGNPNGGGRE